LSVSLSRPRRPSLSASLSLHDALPIWIRAAAAHAFVGAGFAGAGILAALFIRRAARVGSPAAHRLPGPIGVVSAIGRLLGAPPAALPRVMLAAIAMCVVLIVPVVRATIVPAVILRVRSF